MSRSTVAKSRAEKGGKSSSAATPAVTHEIIPGKFTDQDWNVLLEHDEGDDFILDIVEDACTSALDIIFANYIQRQLVPYTVLQAKDAIIQIIEWQFLTRDDGETEIEADAGWQQDEEPEPAVTDCWAQGSVPRTLAPPKTPDDLKVENLDTVEEEDERLSESEEQQIAPEPEIQKAEERVETEGQRGEEEEENGSSVPVEESCQEETPVLQPTPPTESAQETPPGSTKSRKKYRPHKGKLKSAGISKMTDSLDDTEFDMMMDEMTPPPYMSPDPGTMQMPLSCHSLLKLQEGRPPGNRDVFFDEKGNVVGVTKIDPSRLPSHKVKTNFQVVDPAVEAAQARLDAMRTGRYVKAVPPAQYQSRSHKTGASGGQSPRIHTVSSKASGAFGGSTHEGMSGLPPPLIESMDVSPGVTVREGDRIKTGPRHQPRKTDLIAMATQRGLRPVNMKPKIPTILLSDLLEQTPLIKPITENRPIPPIPTPPMATQ